MEGSSLEARQFHVIDGEVHPSGPWIGSAYARDLGPASIFFAIEPVAAIDDALVDRAVDTLTASFQRANLSLTGALLRGMRAAHEELAVWNRNSLREQRGGLGISCLAVRDGVAYLAQAGPALAYFRTGASFHRFASNERDEALGLADAVNPLLTRHTLMPSDTVAMASSALVSGADQIGSALTLPPDEAIHKLQIAAGGTTRCAVLLLTVPTAYLAKREL
jgi:hypothetical protein